MRLQGKVAIVTGSSRGIGRAIARAFSAEGASTVVTYRKNLEAARETVRGLAHPERSLCLQVNVVDRASVRRIIASTLKKFGRLDVFVNNAGMLQQKPFETITDADWDRILNANLKSVFICSQEALRAMKRRGSGAIVNLSSIGGQWGGELAVHYAASKAGIISLTRSLAKIYTCHGIRANAIAPGLVETEMIAAELSSKAGKRKLASVPIGRAAKPEEIAAIAVFLASDESNYVSGQTISANGGMYFS